MINMRRVAASILRRSDLHIYNIQIHAPPKKNVFAFRSTRQVWSGYQYWKSETKLLFSRYCSWECGWKNINAPAIKSIPRAITTMKTLIGMCSKYWTLHTNSGELLFSTVANKKRKKSSMGSQSVNVLMTNFCFHSRYRNFTSFKN